MTKTFLTKLHKYIILLCYLKNTRFLLQYFEISKHFNHIILIKQAVVSQRSIDKSVNLGKQPVVVS